MAEPVKATLTVLDYTTGGKHSEFRPNPIVVQFNPSDLSRGRTLSVNRKQGRVCGVPQVTGSDESDLSLSLTFDTADAGWIRPRDVTKNTPLGALLAVVDMTQLVRGKRKRAAPWLRFEWGTDAKHREYSGFLKRLDYRLTMFAPDGTPVRATATVTLEHYVSPDQCLKEHGEPAPQTSRWIVQGGQTITGIAAQAYGDSSQWRHIADRNGLADPMRLAAGDILMVPSLE